MSKKEIKNNYPENPFGDPKQYQWGKNIWGNKFPIVGAVLIMVTLVIVIWADQKGLIDWTQSEDPLEIQNPYLKKDTLK